MPLRPITIFPKALLSALRKPATAIRLHPLTVEMASAEAPAVFARMDSAPAGLSEEQAAQRLDKFGPNAVDQQQQFPRLRILFHALVNPLVILLTLLAVVTFISSLIGYCQDNHLSFHNLTLNLVFRFLTTESTSDVVGGWVMLGMVVLGVTLKFFQEARADSAAAALKAMINVTATVLRDGKPLEVPVSQVVPGDVVKLAAGDMIPGDLRIVAAKDLFIVQGSMTGESFPVEKFDAPEKPGAASPVELKSICFFGTSVESGSATGVIVATGFDTYLGGMASAIMGQPAPTSFDKGISRFTWLMIRFMLVMVPLVFLVNGLTKHNWKDAFFFAMAVAVGLTPEMLPMIVTVCLSRGAIAMSRKKVIVKRLNSIQNLGAMDVLCTDKTGTLTMDRVILERHCDVVRKDDDGVLELAFLNSHFQTGLRNVLDRAVLDHKELHQQLNIAAYAKADEIPFDFNRRRMSVVVARPDQKHVLIAKGAPESIFACCTQFELEGRLYPMDQILMDDLRDEYEQLSSDGFRVLAVAYRTMDPKPAYARDDERDMVLRGYIAFLDPPKDTAAKAVEALGKHGVGVKVLTGDNELVTRKICSQVGIPVEFMLLGAEVEPMTDAELADAAEKTTVFARMSPAHKQRVIRALQSRGHVVGFLGDGINDAPALRAADVGISVDTAVDIARESADAILLEKNLLVLEEGVLEGRKVFANILKYIRMGASSNFGNMFSVLGASIFVPFLPMEPIQILTNNLLYDFSQVPIPADNVDPEQIAKPRPWSMGEITRFILFIGPCSSIFDYTTYLMMLYLFNCWDPAHKALFQTGWFVESLLTQTLIIHVIRTGKIPFIQSWASWPLVATSLAVAAVGIALPFTPLARPLGLTALPAGYWPLLLATLLCYVVLTQGVKTWLLTRKWI